MPLPENTDKQRAWYILQGYSIVEDSFGTRYWYLNGKLHREDGPAAEYEYGTKIWYLNGKRHREDGPASEYANGIQYFYLNGIRMCEEEHRIAVQKLREEQNNATS